MSEKSNYMNGWTIKSPGSPTTAMKIDPESEEYIDRTILRLEIFADRKLPTDDDKWDALAEYGYALAKRQYDSILTWLRMRKIKDTIEKHGGYHAA